MSALVKAPARSAPKQSAPGKNKSTATPVASTVTATSLQTSRPPAACACGGDCPKCRPRRRTALESLGLTGPGELLPDTLRREFRLHSGHDPLGVRLHTDTRAAATAQRFHANAFTFGSHIVFGSGRFAPHTRAGRRLLFHELIHVIQQQGARENSAAPTVSADRGLELEAQRSSPGPVLGRLRQRVIQKEDGAEAPPEPILNEGENFRWIGPNEAPTIVVSTAWLRQLRVPRTATEILGSRYPQVLRPILLDLVPRYPWATAERTERGVPTAFVSNIESSDWDQPEMRFVLGTNIFLFLGLPPDRPIQIFGSETGLQCYIDMTAFYGGDATSASLSAEAREAAKSQATQALLLALEETVEAPLDPIAATELARLLPASLPDTPSVYRFNITEEAPSQLFGEAAWREFIDANPIDDAAPGAIIDLGGATFQASPQLTPEDLEFAQRILREVFGESPAGAPPPENPQYLSHSDLLALRALDQHPDRAAIIDQFRQARELGGSGDNRASLRDLIETAAANVDWERAESSTRFTAERGDEDETPIVPRPVRGQITNPDRLVPGMEAQFRFQTLDPVDALRVSHVRIHWEAWRVETDTEGNVIRTFIDDDSTNYIETRAESLINERTFDLTFATEGDYEIHAFVDHNFYLPAHFMTMVRVKTESARADEARAASADAFGYETAIDDEYRFTEINDEEFLTGTLLGGPLGGRALSAVSEDYEQGSRAEGSLVERVANDATYAFEQRISELDSEISRLDASILALSGTGNSDVVEYLRERRDRLNTALDRVREIYGTPDTTEPVTYGVATQAFFISRRSGVRNTRLRLLCWYTLTGSGDSEQFNLHLIDQTELTETDHYEFDIQTADFEAGMRHLFLELGRSYPDGTLSFGFQVHTHEEGATNRLVRYERVTDTLNTDMREVIFSTAVNLTVNLVALILTLFPPTTALGITLGLAYNAASLAASHGEDLRTGTLHGDRLALDLGMLALDLIPAIGRLTGRFTIGTVAYRTMELSQYAGMAVMLTDDGFRALTHLRDTQMTQLADLQQQIRELEDVNASAPQLDSLREQERQLIAETRTAAVEVFGELAATQGLILGSTMMIGHVAEPYLTTPRPGADVPPATPRIGDSDTPSLRPHGDETLLPPAGADSTVPPPPRDTGSPTPPRDLPEADPAVPTPDDRTAAGGGRRTPPGPPPSAAPSPAHSPEALLDLLRDSAVLPPPLPRDAVLNPPPNNSTFAQGNFTAAEAYAQYNQALALSTGREVAIYHNEATGEYAIRIGHEVGVSGPPGGGFHAVVHYHPNPHHAFQLRLPAPADIFHRDNLIRAFGQGRPVREFVEFTIPGRGRGRIEYGLEPGQAQPVYIRIFEPGVDPVTHRFANEIDYAHFWSDFDDMVVAPGTPLYRQMMDNADASRPRDSDRSTADTPPRSPGDQTAPPADDRTMAGSGDGPRPPPPVDETPGSPSEPSAPPRPPRRVIVRPREEPSADTGTPPAPTVAPSAPATTPRPITRRPRESDGNFASRLMEAERRAHWESINGPAGRSRENPARWGRVEQSFTDLVAAMQNMQERLRSGTRGLGHLLPSIDRTPLDSVVDIFVMRNETLRNLRDTLQVELRALAAANNIPLRTMREWTDLQNFLRGNSESGGVPSTIGNLRPDEVAFLLDESRIDITDYTTQPVGGSRLTVHAFKTRVYQEVMRAIVGPGGPTVRARDVRVRIDRTTDRIDPSRTQEGDWMD